MKIPARRTAFRIPRPLAGGCLLTAGCLLAGCASRPRLQDTAGAAAPGPVRGGPGAHALALAEQPRAPAPAESVSLSPGQLPDRIILPASYRFMVLDGHFALVREADPQALLGGATTLRVVAGEISRGELAYQPGLLPQELAAEVISSRSSVARMEEALEGVMQRSRDLAARAEALDERNRELQQWIAALRARLEASPPTPAHPGEKDAEHAILNH